MKYINWFRSLCIPVSFVNVDPDFLIDTTLFDTFAFNRISSKGINVSVWSLLRCAAVHYKGKHKSPLTRNKHARLETRDAFGRSSVGSLKLRKESRSEFEAKSTELIAVGICVRLATKLFNINRNRINPIVGSGTRCDFSCIKHGKTFQLEAKGRECDVLKTMANVFWKKHVMNTCQPKYGILSELPRNGGSAEVYVVDPETEIGEVSDFDVIIRLLSHYSRVSDICGFYRLSLLLEKRAKQIVAVGSIETFHQQSLNYENIMKLGTHINILTDGFSAELFASRDARRIFEFIHETHTARFAMDSVLLQILESQDYVRLLEYSFFSDDDFQSNDVMFSAGNDGCILVIAPNERFA